MMIGYDNVISLYSFRLKQEHRIKHQLHINTENMNEPLISIRDKLDEKRDKGDLIQDEVVTQSVEGYNASNIKH